jgi:hypothetical protein
MFLPMWLVCPVLLQLCYQHSVDWKLVPTSFVWKYECMKFRKKNFLLWFLIKTNCVFHGRRLVSPASAILKTFVYVSLRSIKSRRRSCRLTKSVMLTHDARLQTTISICRFCYAQMTQKCDKMLCIYICSIFPLHDCVFICKANMYTKCIWRFHFLL